MCAFIRVQHLAAIFSNFTIQHLTTSDRSSSMRVIFVANGLHIPHVRFTYTFIAALIKYNAWVIAVVDDSIPHQCFSLFPSYPGYVSFRITGLHRLHQADPVERFNILFPGSDVHPTNEITIAFYYHSIAVITEPCRD